MAQYLIGRKGQIINKVMTKAYRDVREIVERDGITYREAAFLLGVGRVAHVSRLRGFI